MGYQNRDYFRDGSYTARLAGWGVEFTPVVKYLIVANVVVFLLQIFTPRAAPAELPEAFQAAIERQEAELERAKHEAARASGKGPASGSNGRNRRQPSASTAGNWNRR